MYGAFVTGAGEVRGGRVEGDAIDLRSVYASSQLSQWFARVAVPHANQSALLRGRRDLRPVCVQSELSQVSVVGLDERGLR